MDRSEMKPKFFDALNNLGKNTVTRAEVKKICSDIGLKGAQFFTKLDENRAGRGLYRVPGTVCNMQTNVIPMSATVEKSKDKIVNVGTLFNAALRCKKLIGSGPAQ